ncbi:MAG: 50S ribosomal protein L22 [Kiritimatiellae bacterium]|jgi:large subunit ribosomal protein L22|nr:50S ribosomal protein L22 [Kiritimatiellia bacterium]NLD90800.1 50S ribosomal protein L22 [Lentisphaerota bacterium]HOU22168.1 50S ribosomal protein L22 [Kiritimatiellia bacterium]HPC20676.1 50S ribosomal protein L22 [Kiritimatiellia bacterium]HQN80564.1 50S ribosomal protein L22 [Kiritimatiellia bacterium]
MEIRAVSKYVRLSPTKARDLTRAIQGRRVGEALQVVELNKRKAAVCLGKTLKSAIANAENNAELSADKLWVARAVVENGPTIPRYWPRARGSAAPIRKKTCHIRVTLTDEPPSRK